ncbi:MAG: hypothetical protein K2G96_03335, partial [Clostridia bacterium]|nr:hypothetical protein [Clostridia bacterium]
VHNILTMILRVFDVMDAHNTAMIREKEGDMCDLLLEPEMKGMSQYLIKDLDRAYEEGYALGKANIDKIKKLIND